MKNGIMLTAFAGVLAICGAASANEDELSLEVDVAWVSKYIWYGYDLLDDKAAFQPEAFGLLSRVVGVMGRFEQGRRR